MRKGVALLALLVLFAAPAVIAQEDGPLVSITFVKVKPGMEQAFQAASMDHRDWHRDVSKDSHYYTVSQVVTGPRTGQYAFVQGPMSAEEMDAADAFRPKDFADIGSRGLFGYIDSIETVILTVMPGMGNPAPDDYEESLIHVFEIRVNLTNGEQFNQALRRMNEIQTQVGGETSYSAWATVRSGAPVGTYWFANWVDGWGDTEDPERQQMVIEAAGGQEAFQELMGEILGSIAFARTVSYRAIPEMAYQPGQ